MNGLTLTEVGVSLLGRRVVDDVTLTVPAGHWLTVVGPNGAGKSTLLRAVAGAVPHDGRIAHDDVPLADLRSRQRARTVAVVPQEPTRPEGMAVVDYVLLGRTPYVPYLGIESATDLAVVGDLLDTLELLEFAERPLTSLSSGEFQRTVLARALAQEAPLLLLDEPTSALDLGHAQQVLELVDEMRSKRGLTVISALHDLTTAGQYADSLVLLVAGAIVAEGVAKEVLTEELIAAHYGARVRVLDDPDEGLVVIPMRERVREDPP
ncbi:MAG: ABC transporter ATP-binding protein [Nocardioidaceae bacterium]